MKIVDELRALEFSLLDPAIRKDPVSVSLMLAENFKEFGASGRVYSKPEVMAFLAAEEDFTPPTVEAFHVELQTADIALVTYKSVRDTVCALRSSVWIRSSDNWKMLFHQGTRASNPEE